MSGRSTKRRIAAILAAGLLGLALLLSGGLTLVLSTEAGTGWILSRLLEQVNQIPGQQITIDDTEGTLTSALQLNNIDYRSEAARVRVDQAAISWNPLSLLSARLSVTQLEATDIQVELLPPATPAEAASQPTTPLIDFAPLPVIVDLASVSVRRLVIQQPQQSFVVDALSLTALLQQQTLELSDIDVSAQDFQLAGDLALVLRDNLFIDAELQWQFSEDLYPDSGPASGLLTVAGDLVSLQLQHQLQRPFMVNSTGSLDTGLAGELPGIDLIHSGDTLVVPQTPIENLALNDLTLTTTGGLDLLQIELATRITSELTPTATLAMNANWQAGVLSLRSLQLATPTGQLNVGGQVTIGETVAGTLQYQLIDSAPLDYVDAELPLEILNLSSNGLVDFSLPDGVPQGSLQLTELSGEFGDYPFQGQGRIRYT
ncbi:MAG: hypothetical protein KJN90_07490, partial [Gammaproteobacteria bacterium]|nr:hypothetical protein [Gammaproteobacteria bacterium]